MRADEVPTAPGYYLDDEGDIWRLGRDGTWAVTFNWQPAEAVSGKAQPTAEWNVTAQRDMTLLKAL